MEFSVIDEKTISPTVIKVVGVGGGGSNAVNHMIDADIKNIRMIHFATVSYIPTKPEQSSPKHPLLRPVLKILYDYLPSLFFIFTANINIFLLTPAEIINRIPVFRTKNKLLY